MAYLEEKPRRVNRRQAACPSPAARAEYWERCLLQRNFHLDQMRVIACLMVIAIHVCNIYNRAFPDLAQGEYILAALVNAFSRVSVPVFFMISGALMAGRTPDVNKSLRRFGKFLAITVFWCGFYYVWGKLYLHKTFDAHAVLSSPPSAHLWYLYALLAIYLALPLIQTLVRGLPEKMMDYMMILFAVSVFGGYVLDLISVPVKYPIALIAENQYLGFFLLGYMLYHREIHLSTGKCAALGAVCIALVTALTCWKSFAADAHKDTYFQYRDPLLVIAAACTFLILLRLPAGAVPRAWEKFVHHVADNSFGIYIFHGVFLNMFSTELDVPGIPAYWGIWLFIALIFVLTDICVSVYKKTLRAAQGLWKQLAASRPRS
jgi:surface polysaccharide O-acyltransferase-like enzyme